MKTNNFILLWMTALSNRKFRFQEVFMSAVHFKDFLQSENSNKISINRILQLKLIRNKPLQ